MAAGEVLLLTGPPGAGKTTTARLIASDAILGVHVEADSFFHHGESGYVQSWSKVMRAVALAATAYAHGGYATIVTGIIGPNGFLTPLHQTMAASGLKVSYAILKPSLDVCIARAAGRDGLSNASVLTQFWEAFTDCGPFEGHVVGIDDLAPELVAGEVTSRWQSGALRL